jgi:uncharacterized protein YjaZ
MNRFVNLSSLLLFLIFISGCTDVKEDNNTKVNSYQFSYEGQNFEIIPFYEEVLEYTSRMKGNILELDQEAIYMESVLEPFNEKSSLDITLDNSLFLSPSLRIEQLEENTNRLLENQEKINLWIEEAILESVELLPSKDTKIHIFPANPEDWFFIEANGVGGAAFSDNGFILFIDPTFSEDALKFTVAHEYHHIVTEQNLNNILDYIIIEGKADSFASIVYPEISSPWATPLSEDEEANVLEILRKNINSADMNAYYKFQGGNPAQGIPMWSNYKIGYQIMKSFSENNPDISIEEWTNLDAKEIVKRSKYNGLLQ